MSLGLPIRSGLYTLDPIDGTKLNKGDCARFKFAIFNQLGGCTWFHVVRIGRQRLSAIMLQLANKKMEYGRLDAQEQIRRTRAAHA